MEIAPGAPVLPEDVALMRSALDEVVNILPAFQRTSAMRTKLASRASLPLLQKASVIRCSSGFRRCWRPRTSETSCDKICDTI